MEIKFVTGMKLLDVVWDVGLVRSVQLPLSAC